MMTSNNPSRICFGDEITSDSSGKVNGFDVIYRGRVIPQASHTSNMPDSDNVSMCCPINDMSKVQSKNSTQPSQMHFLHLSVLNNYGRFCCVFW